MERPGMASGLRFHFAQEALDQNGLHVVFQPAQPGGVVGQAAIGRLLQQLQMPRYRLDRVEHAMEVYGAAITGKRRVGLLLKVADGAVVNGFQGIRGDGVLGPASELAKHQQDGTGQRRMFYQQDQEQIGLATVLGGERSGQRAERRQRLRSRLVRRGCSKQPAHGADGIADLKRSIDLSSDFPEFLMPASAGAGKAMVVPGPRDGGLEMRVQGADSQAVEAVSPCLLPDHGPERRYDGAGEPERLPLPADRAAQQRLE